MSDIRAALAQLYRREAEIEIEDVDIRGQDYTVSIAKVWPLVPPSRQVVTDTPCFLNLVPDSRTQFFPALTRSNFTVNMRLVCHDADTDIAGEIALAFYPEIVDKLRSNLKLGLSGWFINELRTEGEFLRIFDDISDSAGRTLVGLDLYVDLTWNGAGTNAGGTAPP
jgi:hypothetical protein